LILEIKIHNLEIVDYQIDAPVQCITKIINGKREISAESALRLSKTFGNSARFWMKLQTRYDLAIAERDIGQRIDAEVSQAA